MSPVASSGCNRIAGSLELAGRRRSGYNGIVMVQMPDALWLVGHLSPFALLTPRVVVGSVFQRPGTSP
jgi:hypothetical protein